MRVDDVASIICQTLVLGSGAWVLPFWREPGKTCPQLRSEVKDPR